MKFRHGKIKNTVLYTKFPKHNIVLGDTNEGAIDINILNDSKYEFNSISNSVFLSHINDNNIFLIAFGLYYNSILQTLCMSLGNNITSKGAKEIAKAIETNSTLQKLDISYNNISYDGLEAIINSLKKNSSMLEIVMTKPSSSEVLKVNVQRSHYTLSSEGATNFEALIVTSLLYNNNCTDIKELDFSDKKISDAVIVALSNLLRIYPLQKLNIAHNQLSEVGVARIVESLKLNASLQELNMSHNKVTVEGYRKIAELINVNQTLQHLDISYCGIPEDGAIHISKSYLNNNILQTVIMSWDCDQNFVNTACLHPNCDFSGKALGSSGTQILLNLSSKIKIKELDLSYNNITYDGIIAVTDFLKQSTTLRQLSISHNYISIEGAKMIVEAIQYNTTLQKLDISYCGFSDDMPSITSNIFCKNVTLKEFNLSHNNISYKVARVIAELVKIITALQKLDISYCNITDDGILTLTSYIQQNNALKWLIMSHNKISMDGANKIAEVIQSNRTLQELDISYCGIPDDGALAISRSFKIADNLLQLKMSWKNDQFTIDTAAPHCGLSGQTIGSIDAKIVPNLLCNSKIKELSISHNALAVDEINIISEVIQTNATLQNLDISDCGISDDELAVISDVLVKNNALQVLDMSSNIIKIKGATKIAKVIEFKQHFRN